MKNENKQMTEVICLSMFDLVQNRWFEMNKVRFSVNSEPIRPIGVPSLQPSLCIHSAARPMVSLQR